MKKYASLISLWKKSDHWTAGFKTTHVALAAAVPQDHGRVVTRVDVGQAAFHRIVLGVKQGRVTIRRRRLANEAVDSPHQVRRISDDRSQSTQRCFEACHHKCGAHALP